MERKTLNLSRDRSLRLLITICLLGSVQYVKAQSPALDTNSTILGNFTPEMGDIGFGNSIFGFDAGREIRGTLFLFDNSYENSLFGYQSGFNLLTGDRNLMFGVSSGYYNDGSNNVFIGYHSGYNNTGSNNVFLGHEAGKDETGSNRLFIHNSASATPLIFGNFNSMRLGINYNSPLYTLHVGGSFGATGDAQFDGAVTATGDITTSGRLISTGDLFVGDNGYLDDDLTSGGASDDWIRLKGHIQMRSSSADYGTRIISTDNLSDYTNITQVSGESFFSDSDVAANYFLKGAGRNLVTGGELEVTSDLTARGLLIAKDNLNLDGNLRGNTSSMNMGGIGNVTLSMDYDNDAAETSVIRFGKNGLGNSVDFVELMRIAEDGKIGIGTSDPQTKLSVIGNVRSALDGTEGKYVELKHGPNHGIVNIGGGGDLQFRSNNENRLVLHSNGDLDITGTITGQTTIEDINITGGITINPAAITQDNNYEEILVTNGSGQVRTRSVESIESPWLLEIFNPTDTTGNLVCNPEYFQNIVVDIFDLNGNLRIGNGMYIDDDMEPGDNGADNSQPDDWMRFSNDGFIEFKSADANRGLLLNDDTDNGWLNFFHEEGSSYFTNKFSTVSESVGNRYFLKSTGRNVEFGGLIQLNTSAIATGSNTDQVVVMGTGGTLKVVPRSEFATSSGSSIWTINGDNIRYENRVEVGTNVDVGTWLRHDGDSDTKLGFTNEDEITLMAGSTPAVTVNATDMDVAVNFTTNNLKVTGLMTGASYGKVLVANEDGFVGYKDLSTMSFNHWSKDSDGHLTYDNGTITSTQGIFSQVNGSSAVALMVKDQSNSNIVNFKVDGGGNVRARKLELDLQTSWPDYVFKKEYDLRPLEEVEAFVQANHHLPEVPNEEEVLENGVDVAAMESILLKKVEELTLYIIEQNKTIKEQQQQITAQQEELTQQKSDFAARLEALEQKVGQ